MRANEVCRLLNISKDTLRRWRLHKDKEGNHSPLIKYTRIGPSRFCIYDDDDVYGMLGKRRMKNNWCVVYARVEDKRNRTELEDQIQRCTDFALKLGLNVDKVYAEFANGFATGRSNRKAYHQMLKDMFDRNIGILIIESPDRVNIISHETLKEFSYYYKVRLIYLLNSPFNVRYKDEVVKDVSHEIQRIKMGFDGRGSKGKESSHVLYDAIDAPRADAPIIPGDLLDAI